MRIRRSLRYTHLPVMALVLVTWYATLFHYTRLGWILTVFMSLSAIKGVGLYFGWKKVAPRLLSVVEAFSRNPILGNTVIILFSCALLLLGIYVY